MRTYEMKDGVFTCIVETHNYCGSLSYNFITGELSAHRPDNMENRFWFWYVKEFMAICHKMVKPKPDSRDDF